MPIIEIALIQVRRGQEYQTGVPQLRPGEMAWAEDTENLYIGKRIVEGASNDSNSRILTEKDLNKIFQIAQASVAQANSSTAYRYRGDIPYGNQPGQLMSTTSTYANKLNNWVSLTDFNPVWPPFEGNDITTILQNAIGIIASNNLSSGVIFQNGTGVGPVPILIPAGNWTISASISLPPFTTLIGDGIGMTVLNYSSGDNSDNPMFQTVDAGGLSFTEGMETSNGENARHVSLRNMSLIIPSNSITDAAMISLDNVQDVYLENLFIGSTSTVDITSDSIGIKIRTSMIAGPDLTLLPSNNININNCIFNRIAQGIYNEGSVNRITIRDSEFNWLNQGISSYNTSTLNCVNGLIDNNKFENIATEAILIGTDTNVVTSYVVSSNNTFRNVGCDYEGEDSQITSVITFNDLGCQSINDYFDRLATATVDNSFSLWQPWVSGNATVKSGATYFKTLNVGETENIIKLPMAVKTQSATINYKLDNTVMTRTGTLTVNISKPSDGYSDVTDSYSYFESEENASTFLTFSTNLNFVIANYIILTCNNSSGLETTLEYTVDLIN